MASIPVIVLGPSAGDSLSPAQLASQWGTKRASPQKLDSMSGHKIQYDVLIRRNRQCGFVHQRNIIDDRRSLMCLGQLSIQPCN